MTRIYTMQHDSIQFSSLNSQIVEHYQTTLSTITERDIKENRVEGRHPLLVNMALGGDCPMFYDYLRTCSRKDETIKARLEPYKHLSTLPFLKVDVEKRIIEEIKESTGWVLTPNY